MCVARSLLSLPLRSALSHTPANNHIWIIHIKNDLFCVVTGRPVHSTLTSFRWKPCCHMSNATPKNSMVNLKEIVINSRNYLESRSNLTVRKCLVLSANWAREENSIKNHQIVVLPKFRNFLFFPHAQHKLNLFTSHGNYENLIKLTIPSTVWEAFSRRSSYAESQVERIKQKKKREKGTATVFSKAIRFDQDGKPRSGKARSVETDE